MALNLSPDREREVSVLDVDVPLAVEALDGLLRGRQAYRRTRYIVARRGDRVAVLEIRKRSEVPLFSEITAVRMLAGPEESVLVTDPAVDIAVPSQLAALAEGSAARCVVVEGRYSYVGFVIDPAPTRIRVLDVVPPDPPKLLDQARRVLDTADDLPSVALDVELLDLRTLAAGVTAPTVLFPCRASGLVADGDSAYLDQRPERADWVMIGCARSREIHRWFYGDEPPVIDSCPRRRIHDDGVPTLVRCCLLETGLEHHGRVVVVPWGASLTEVRAGLTAALGQAGS